jgi:flagellar motor switch protein FliM
MDKVLSQEEINALFSAMSSEELGLRTRAQKVPDSRRIASYDFHRVDRIPQDQMRSVYLLHEHFGRNFASSLSAYLRTIAEVRMASLEQVSYSMFVKSLPDPTLFASIGMRPLDANITMELSPSLAFPMIDIILGGPGRPLSENRNLTEIELNIIEGIIKLAMRDLQAAWHPIMEFDFFLEGKGTKTQVFQVVSPAESVIAARLELKIGESSGTMNLCIPAHVLKMLRNKMDQQWSVRRQKTTGNEAERLFELMKPMPVLLSCEIRGSRLTLDDLLKVSAGDIIELNERVDDPVLLCVGGMEKFVGRIVQRRGKKAFEISGRYTG